MAITEKFPQSHSSPPPPTPFQKASQIKWTPFCPPTPCRLRTFASHFYIKSLHIPSILLHTAVPIRSVMKLLAACTLPVHWLKQYGNWLFHITKHRSHGDFWAPWFNDRSVPSRASFLSPLWSLSISILCRNCLIAWSKNSCQQQPGTFPCAYPMKEKERVALPVME